MIYLICFFSSVVLFILSEKKYKHYNKQITIIFVALALIIPSALAGMRDFSIGTDISVYGNYWFNLTNEVSFFKYIKWALSSDIGILYAMLNYVVSIFTDDVHWFYFFLSLITNTFIYIAVSGYKNKLSVPFAMYIYYILFFNSSLNILRQSVAIAVLLLAYRYLSENNYSKFLIFLVIASMFHTTALLMIVLIPIFKISNWKNKQICTIILFTITLVIMLGYSKILELLMDLGFLGERYFGYLNKNAGGGRIIRTCLYSVIFIFIIISYNSLTNYGKRNSGLVNCSLLSFVFTILLFLGNNQIIRIAYYFDITLVLILPMISQKIVILMDSGKRIKLVYHIIGIVLLIYWLLTIVIQNNGQTYPYVLGV